MPILKLCNEKTKLGSKFIRLVIYKSQYSTAHSNILQSGSSTNVSYLIHFINLRDQFLPLQNRSLPLCEDTNGLCTSLAASRKRFVIDFGEAS